MVAWLLLLSRWLVQRGLRHLPRLTRVLVRPSRQHLLLLLLTCQQSLQMQHQLLLQLMLLLRQLFQVRRSRWLRWSKLQGARERQYSGGRAAVTEVAAF
jgi:hypothetical protein